MNSKYITITDGEDYRTIAAKMTGLGYKMNHATARNILLTGMKKFVGGLAKELGQPLSEEEVAKLVMRQDIHEVIGDVLELCTSPTARKEEDQETSCPAETQPSNRLG